MILAFNLLAIFFVIMSAIGFHDYHEKRNRLAAKIEQNKTYSRYALMKLIRQFDLDPKWKKFNRIWRNSLNKP